MQEGGRTAERGEAARLTGHTDENDDHSLAAVHNGMAHGVEHSEHREHTLHGVHGVHGEHGEHSERTLRTLHSAQGKQGHT